MSTNGPGEAQPEYLGHGGPATNPVEGPAGPGRRTGIIVGAALAVVAAVGIGGYGLVQLMAGGSSPASVVPADTLGYVSLDLDPSAGQKIEAFRIMRKFPSLKKGLHLGGQDDIRRAIMEQIVEAGGCKRLSYSRDVEPWIGDRVAFAAVPERAEGAVPLIALQVSDQARAKKGIRAIGSCEGEGSQPGVSFAGDYALITDTQPDADRMAKDAKAASLADDADFKTWTGRTGDPGIVTMYVSKDAPAAIAMSGHHDRPGLNPLGGPVDGAFKNFRGGAGVVRFHAGAVEAEFT